MKYDLEKTKQRISKIGDKNGLTNLSITPLFNKLRKQYSRRKLNVLEVNCGTGKITTLIGYAISENSHFTCITDYKDEKERKEFINLFGQLRQQRGDLYLAMTENVNTYLKNTTDKFDVIFLNCTNLINEKESYKLFISCYKLLVDDKSSLFTLNCSIDILSCINGYHDNLSKQLLRFEKGKISEDEITNLKKKTEKEKIKNIKD
jgi:SAM-dependent methyltransferase